MAPSRRKPRLDHGLIMEPRYSYRGRRKQPERPRRPQTRGPVHVQELVRELLNIDGRSRAIRGRNLWPRRAGETVVCHRRESSYETSVPSESTDTLEESEYVTGSRASSTSEDSTEMMETANSSVATSSKSSIVSDFSVGRIARRRSIDNENLEKRSLVRLINNCVMAGLEEGKRQAKKYLRRALSFGLKAGYLIPADPRGKVIRLLPELTRTEKVRGKTTRKQTRNVKSGPALGIWDHIGHRQPGSARSVKKRLADASVGVKIPAKRKKLSRPGNSGRETNQSKTKARKKIVDGSGGGRNSRKAAPIKRKAKENTGKKAARSRNKYTTSPSQRRTRSTVSGKKQTDNSTETRLDRGDGDRDKVESAGNETNQTIQPPEKAKSVPNQEECEPGVRATSSRRSVADRNDAEEAAAAATPGASYENDGNERIRIST